MSRSFLTGAFAVAALLVIAPAYSVNVAAKLGTYATPSENNHSQVCVSQSRDAAKELFVNGIPQSTVNDPEAEIWSGTRQELEAVARNLADRKNLDGYAFENTTHLGRNATMLVPATLSEMKWEIEFAGNPSKWERMKRDGYHHPKATADCSLLRALWLSFFDTIEKYVNTSRGEVVYDKKTGKIVTDFHMGTKNYGNTAVISHPILDMWPHEADADYKYVGILYVHDTSGIYHIVDGQSGKYMSRRKVAIFPTTMSDMWKNSGPVCVASDMLDLSDISTFIITCMERKNEYMRELERKTGRITDSDLQRANEITKKVADIAMSIDKWLMEIHAREEFMRGVWQTILAPASISKLAKEHDRLLKALGLPSAPVLPASAGIIKYSDNL